MGRKVNPIGIRVGSFLPWKSRWFSDNRNYKLFLIEDYKIRKLLMERLKPAGVTSIVIERLSKTMVISIAVSRPGVVIGRGGSGIEEIKKIVLEKIREVRKADVSGLKIDLKVDEVKNPEISAHLVAERIVSEFERRMPHRRVVMRAMERVMAAGAKGVKVVLSGRIEGAEISRVEKFHLGSVPTQTLRETIDYAQMPALLKRGYVGIKVWVHRKEEE